LFRRRACHETIGCLLDCTEVHIGPAIQRNSGPAVLMTTAAALARELLGLGQSQKAQLFCDVPLGAVIRTDEGSNQRGDCREFAQGVRRGPCGAVPYQHPNDFTHLAQIFL
jgi:hypothetical protein